MWYMAMRFSRMKLNYGLDVTIIKEGGNNNKTRETNLSTMQNKRGTWGRE